MMRVHMTFGIQRFAALPDSDDHEDVEDQDDDAEDLVESDFGRAAAALKQKIRPRHRRGHSSGRFQSTGGDGFGAGGGGSFPKSRAMPNAIQPMMCVRKITMIQTIRADFVAALFHTVRMMSPSTSRTRQKATACRISVGPQDSRA